MSNKIKRNFHLLQADESARYHLLELDSFQLTALSLLKKTTATSVCLDMIACSKHGFIIQE